MNLDALILVLAGAMAHAAWNYLAKLAAGGRSFVAVGILSPLAYTLVLYAMTRAR